MTTNYFENYNTVADIIVAGQPVSMAVISPLGEVIEINSPDGRDYFLIDPESRIGHKVDIDDFVECKVVKYEYGEPFNPKPPVPQVLVETYEYSGKLRGMVTDAFFAKESSEDGEKEALIALQNSKTKTVMLMAYDEWDDENYSYGIMYGKTYNTSSKQENISFQEEYQLIDDTAEVNITASKSTYTKSKSTEFSVEINRQMDFGEDSFYSFDSLHATKEENTKTTSKWQSAEVVRQYGENWSSEYLWYSFDQETTSKRVMNSMEVYIDQDDENFYVYMEGEFNFNTWKYTGSGSEKVVDFYANYGDGVYEQKFVIHESNSRKETTTTVTREFDGEIYSEFVDTVVYDYRKDKETVSGSSFYYSVEEDYDVYGDFIYGVEEYTGHDIFGEISSFENEAIGFVSSLQDESYKLKGDATELALTKGSATQQYLVE